MMSSPTDLGRLNSSAWDQLQDLAERLETLWREQGPVDLNVLLPPPGEPARVAYLVELIKTDLEIRWRRGKGVRLDWYIERFEELGTVSEVSPRLIYEEYRVRQLHGDKPDLSSYKRRFERQFPEVERLVVAEPIGTVSPAMPTPVAPAFQPPAPMSSKIVVASEGYRLIERIGAGSFGEVWRAEAPGGIFVAVKKIYRPVGSDADQHEKKALDHIKNLRHPFLLSTHAYWISSEGYLHIAMELADRTLRDRMRECINSGLPGIAPPELLRLMSQSAEALDYVHHEGLFHRDIKPDNILLKNNFAMVGDFGLVRKGATLSMGSAGAGTLAYMGPEVFLGNVCKESDQYSLAVSYVELRTGRRPFPPAANEFQAMMDAREGTPDVSTLDAAEQPVLMRALAKRPDERFPSCLAFIEALQAAVQGEPAVVRVAAPEGWLQPMRRVGPEGYQLLHRLTGSSTVGQFWEAVAPGGKHVALQVIENLDRGGVLKHERAYNLARCFAGAAYVVQVHDKWLADAKGEVRTLADVLNAETEDRVALVVVQELADDDLAHRMGSSRRKLSDDRLGQLLVYLKQAALALDHLNAPIHTYARRQVAIRHCAVRPENLLVVGDQVRITHFDLAQEAAGPVEPLRADSLDLEPGYAAPELLERGGGQVTAYSDQYSLAMAYVKLRTGSLPFDQSQSRNRIIEEQLDGKLNLKALPEAERAIIAKATARRPEDRYPSCAGLIAALENVCRTSLAEIIIEPPPPQEATLERKPPTHRPVADRPTPAHGNWRLQGLGHTDEMDQTLRPGQEIGTQSFCKIDLPPKKQEPPRSEPKPKRPSTARGLWRTVMLVVTVSIAASFMALAMNRVFKAKDDKRTDERDGVSHKDNQQGKDAVNDKDQKPKDSQSKDRKGEQPPIPPYETCLTDLKKDIAEAKWAKVDKDLAALRAALPDGQDKAGEAKIAEALAKAAGQMRKAYGPQLLAADVFRLAAEYDLFPPAWRPFDWVWLECKARLDGGDYTQMLDALAKPDALPGVTESQLDELQELLDQIFNATKASADGLKGVIAGLPKPAAPQAIQKQLNGLLVRSVNRLAELEYAGAKESKQFRDLLALIEKAGDEADARAAALHAECLLRRTGEKQLANDAKTLQDVDKILGRTKSKEPYLAFVRGLALQAQEQWPRAADWYDAASLQDKPRWCNAPRRAFAVTAYYKAAREEWRPGKDKAAARNAVKRYTDAVAIVEIKKMPLEHLADFAQAASAAEDFNEFETALRELTSRPEFKDLPHPPVLSTEVLARISGSFVAWAEKHSAKAEQLLRAVGPALEAVAKHDGNGEAFDFWLGKYYWGLAKTQSAKKPAALKAFGRALGQSQPTKLVDTTGRFADVAAHVGKLEAESAAGAWQIILQAAILPNVNDRTTRQWELSFYQCILLAQNKAMKDDLKDDLKKKRPQLLADVQLIVAKNKTHAYLQVEAHSVAVGGIVKAYAALPEAKQTEMDKVLREHIHELGQLLARDGIFDNWLNRKKDEIVPNAVHLLEQIGETDQAKRVQRNWDAYQQRPKPEGGNHAPRSLERPRQPQAVAVNR